MQFITNDTHTKSRLTEVVFTNNNRRRPTIVTWATPSANDKVLILCASSSKAADVFPSRSLTISMSETHSTEIGLVELEISKIVMFLKGISLSILEGTDAATHSAVLSIG